MQRYKKVVWTVSGLVALVVAAIVALRHFEYRSLRRLDDKEWRLSQGDAEVWRLVQATLRRHGYFTRARDDLLLFGTEEWAAWLVERLGEMQRHKGGLSGQDALYRSEMRLALTFIVNQAPPDWDAWWKGNATKSQRQWLFDGFQAYGLSIEHPLTRSGAIALLRLAGRLAMKYRSGAEVTNWEAALRYNALRVLRDSKVSPWGITRGMVCGDDEALLWGICEYCIFIGGTPRVVANAGQPRLVLWML